MDLVDWVWEFWCKTCADAFRICRGCYTGQLYCGDHCRDLARGEQLRRAQRQYVATEAGRAACARATARYREKKAMASGAAPAGDGAAVVTQQLDVGSPALVSSQDGAQRSAPVSECPVMPEEAGGEEALQASTAQSRRPADAAAWRRTRHWLRFVIDQTLTHGAGGDYRGLRQGRCQLCGHLGPLVRPVPGRRWGPMQSSEA